VGGGSCYAGGQISNRKNLTARYWVFDSKLVLGIKSVTTVTYIHRVAVFLCINEVGSI